MARAEVPYHISGLDLGGIGSTCLYGVLLWDNSSRNLSSHTELALLPVTLAPESPKMLKAWTLSPAPPGSKVPRAEGLGFVEKLPLMGLRRRASSEDHTA